MIKSLSPHSSPVGRASRLLEEGSRIPSVFYVTLLVGSFVSHFFAIFRIFFALLCQHRFFDRFVFDFSPNLGGFWEEDFGKTWEGFASILGDSGPSWTILGCWGVLG